MSTPKLADADATVKFAIIAALGKSAHKTGIVAGPKMDILVADLIESIKAPSTRWAFIALLDHLQHTSPAATPSS